MKTRLKNKVAIVTGAGSGIGRGVALRLAEEEAQVLVVDIDERGAVSTVDMIANSGGRALAYVIDLRHVNEIPNMVDKVIDRWGRLDILINSAGIVLTKPLLEVNEEEWDRVISVNQKGLFFCIQASGARMIHQVNEEVKENGQANRSYRKIVNLSSISGRRGRALQSVYAATKAAIISLTQSAALAFAPYNINVNAIAPSIVETPMWDKVQQDRNRFVEFPTGKTMDSFINSIPLKRMGTVEDMSGTVTFLCSSDADYITGQCINVDGGFEMD